MLRIAKKVGNYKIRNNYVFDVVREWEGEWKWAPEKKNDEIIFE